jgi:hypothetical protein
VGTTFLAIGAAIAMVIALGLRSRMFRLMPLSLRVLFRAVGLVVAGVVLSVLLLFAIIGYLGGGPMGDPCPPYC